MTGNIVTWRWSVTLSLSRERGSTAYHNAHHDLAMVPSEILITQQRRHQTVDFGQNRSGYDGNTKPKDHEQRCLLEPRKPDRGNHGDSSQKHKDVGTDVEETLNVLEVPVRLALGGDRRDRPVA